MKAFSDPESQKTLVIMNLRHDLESLHYGVPQTKYALRLAIENFIISYRNEKILSFKDADKDSIVNELVDSISRIYGK